MSASSVTGKGYGMSNGIFKPENNNGCKCGRRPEPEPSRAKLKTGCYVRSVSGNIATHRAGGAIGVKGC